MRDASASHLVVEEDGTVRALTETGAFHIERLHLNRRQLIAYRRERRLLEAARQSQTRILDGLKDLEEQVKALIAELAQMQRDDLTA
jgi:hypothetical protein